MGLNRPGVEPAWGSTGWGSTGLGLNHQTTYYSALITSTKLLYVERG